MSKPCCETDARTLPDELDREFIGLPPELPGCRAAVAGRNVEIAQDAETGRWYVAKSDVPGLHLEGDDPATLLQRVHLAAPELIALNEGAGSAAE